jgi:two-component system, chemotaxis family, chemotaxis protein CheY
MFAPQTKILIVDDMMTMRKLVAKSLTELGFTNLTDADNGETALEKIKLVGAEKFQLIVSDWNMPKVSGIELLKTVRQLAGYKDVPFILLTAESEKAQVIEAIQARVSGYVTKPFTTAILGEKLKAVHAALQPPKAA